MCFYFFPLFIIIAVDCMSEPDPENGEAIFTITTFGSVLRYSCDEGFDPSNTDDRICMANGKWSGEAVICTSEY